MEFNCPACDTPHAFPDDQIPPEGIVVACTHCGEHITLDPSHSASDALHEAGAGDHDFGGGGHDIPEAFATSDLPVQRPTAGMDQRAPAPPPQREPEPPPSRERASGGAMGDRIGKHAENAARRAEDAARRIGGAASKAFDDVAAQTIEPETDVPAGLSFPGQRPSDTHWSWRDLPRAFLALFDGRRVLWVTAGFWAALVAFAVLQWVGGFLGAKVMGLLGTVFNVAAWLALVGIAALVASVMAFLSHRTIIEQRPATIREGITWTRTWIKSVVGTPIAFVGVVLIAAVAEGAVGFLGRVPFAGPIAWGLLSPAVFALSLAAGATLVLFVYSLPLYLPVIYNEQTGPVQTLKRLVALLSTHGFALVGYVLMSLVMIVVAAAVTIFPAWTAGSMLTARVGGAAMGGNLTLLMAETPAAFLPYLAAMLPPVALAPPTEAGGFGHTLGGIFAGLGGAFGVALVWAALALLYYTAGCIIYAIVTQRPKSA